MPQPIEVKSQSEQQSLPHLHGQAATGGFGGKLAFDYGEEGFYLGAWSVPFARKFTVHLVADCSIGDAASACGNHTEGSERGANVLMIGFGVELRVGQHQADGDGLAGRFQQAG